MKIEKQLRYGKRDSELRKLLSTGQGFQGGKQMRSHDELSLGHALFKKCLEFLPPERNR